MSAQLDNRQEAVAASDRPPVLSEALLANFERACQLSRIDEGLLDPSVGATLSERMTAVVEAVRKADLDGLMRKASWRHRLLGADIEARIKFALSRQACQEALSLARTAAQETGLRVGRLQAALPAIMADQQRLANVAQKAERIAAALPPSSSAAEQDLEARFRRRLANLSTVMAANAMTAAQIPASINYLNQLLGQFAEFDTVLFPVWERHTLALVQAPSTPETIGAARKAARDLVDRLTLADKAAA